MEVKIAFLVLFLFNTPLSKGATVTFYDIVECENKTESEFKMSVSLDGDPKKGSGKIHMPMNLNGDDMFHLDLHQFAEGGWNLFVKEYDGDICSKMEEFFPSAWDKIRQKTSPEIKDECDVPANDYEFEDVHLLSSDIECPSGMTGRYRMDVTIIISDKKAFCVGLDVDVQP